jgi:tetrapyrrole methylase family protein/MazG family protein/ATP diphosphatase
MQMLLGPQGCPWDREQSLSSLRQYVLEEAHEVAEALDGGDLTQLKEELGDLTLQVVFLSELGRRLGAFGPDDVLVGLAEKLIRRHPHVFGEASAATSADVRRRWETIKEEEKGRARQLLDGIPRSLPALKRAQTLSERVSRVGFDWPSGAGSRAKVEEELAELDDAVVAGPVPRVEHELGDLLFALVNLARHCGVDAEQSLHGACERFRRRFGHVEARVNEEHGGWQKGGDGAPTTGLPLAVLDGYWEEAKREGL